MLKEERDPKESGAVEVSVSMSDKERDGKNDDYLVRRKKNTHAGVKTTLNYA